MRAFHKGLVSLVGILFVGLGLWFLIDPRAVEDLYPLRLEGPMAVSEVRAVLGGMMGGIGAAILWLALRAGRLVDAGGVTLFVFGGLLVARVVGYFGEGVPTGPVLNETIFETVVFTIVLVTTLAIRRR